MRISLGFASGIAACLMALASACALAEDLKIGYVSSERIMRESSAAKAAEGRLTQEFAKRDKEIQELGARLKSAADKLDKEGQEQLALLVSRATRMEDLISGILQYSRAGRPTEESQGTVDLETGNRCEISIGGRHDVCFAVRVPVIVEAATAIVLADLMLREQRIPRIL
jgi:signal transduction histidine kinase